MKRTLLHGGIAVVALAFVASSCQKETAQQASSGDSPASAPAAAAAAPAVPKIAVCSLLSAAEVGAIFGKTVIATGSGLACTYGLDPAEKEKQMKAMPGGVGQPGADGNPNLGALANSMAKGGGFPMPSAISDQLNLDLSLAHDAETEDQVKAIYSGMGKTVRGATEPEKHGLNDTIVVGKDIPGVGDWAFTTNVAAINMGMGISTRGRILEARQGPWRITVSATIAPDPGEAKLDAELGEMARAACAKLKAGAN